MPETSSLLATVAFAKNPAHERFVQEFPGATKGRYAIAYLAGVGMLGGHALAESIRSELGFPIYLPEKMYPGRDLAVICDRASRVGLSLVRLGELIMPTHRRANPEAFAGKTITECFEVLEQASRNDTSYYQDKSWPSPRVKPGRAVLYRPGRPTPCETFVGILLGLLQTFGIEGAVRESACLWEGSPYCTFEATW